MIKFHRNSTSGNKLSQITLNNGSDSGSVKSESFFGNEIKQTTIRAEDAKVMSLLSLNLIYIYQKL